MKTSENGLALIRRFEGLELEAYQDEGGVWSIGFGHTGPDVHEGMVVTEEEAERLLQEDVRHAERCVNHSVSVPLTQGEYDALVSFVFNLGCNRLRGSTLLRKLVGSDYDGAALEFGRWTKARVKGGALVDRPGLVARREAERNLFESA